MPPSIAALIFLVGIVGLLYLDRRRDGETANSLALWLPVVWLSIAGSRMISQWLSMSGGISLGTQDQYLEGSPFDRMIFTVMLVIGLGILVSRWQRTSTLLRQNIPILIFFLYCLASVVWSDFPFVALKRWSKAIGNLTMVLIVLTDPNPRLAMKRFVASCGFILVPLSVLLIKYYPQYGRGYLAWVWTPVYTGVSTDKNGLGYDCLFFGLGAMWCVIEALREQAGPYRNRQLLAHGTLLLMVGWLLYKANSATSLIAFAMGAGLLLAVSVVRKPWFVHLLAIAIPVTAVVVFVVLDLDAYMASAVGRDASLTGRTDLWAEVLRKQDSPWFGVGFESYWLGARADYMWEKFWWRPNQAHNGYLETWLTLGWVGVVLLLGALASGYRHGIQSLRRDPTIGTFTLALLGATVVYNLTEAAFKGIHPLWIATLLAVTAVPTLTADRDEAPSASKQPTPNRPHLFETEWAKGFGQFAGERPGAPMSAGGQRLQR